MLARSRRHAPKVRSGCRTCKKRRVKCDETQPKCLRCVKGQYICDGYDIIRPLTVVLLGSAQKRSLAYYRERTAVSMSSFKELELWSRVVLQCAHKEEAVQRMVVALGALHEGSIAAPGQHLGPGLIALEEYGKAISLVSRYGTSMDPGILLLLMVLFLFYDGMSGNAMTTLKHLAAAVRIYDSLEFSQTSQMTNEVLKPVLHRLRKLAITLEMDISTGPQRSLKRLSIISINSFRDADHEIDALTKITSDLTRLFASMSPSEQNDHLGQLQTRLNAWKDAYTTFTDSIRDCASPLMEIAATYIDIRFLLLEIRLTSEPFVPGQTLEGAHLKDVQRLVACCQRLFASLDAGIWSPDAIFQGLDFRMDLTLILAYMLMHCHHPAVRMPVIRLMETWCRDYGSSDDATSLPDLEVLVDVVSVWYGLQDDWTPRSSLANDFDKSLCSTPFNASAGAEKAGGMSISVMISSRRV